MASGKFIVSLYLATFLANSACAPTPVQRDRINQLHYVTLEEHYNTKIMTHYETGPVIELLRKTLGDILPLVENLNGSRLHSMNANGIRIQLLLPQTRSSNSTTPSS